MDYEIPQFVKKACEDIIELNNQFNEMSSSKNNNNRNFMVSIPSLQEIDDEITIVEIDFGNNLREIKNPEQIKAICNYLGNEIKVHHIDEASEVNELLKSSMYHLSSLTGISYDDIKSDFMNSDMKFDLRLEQEKNADEIFDNAKKAICSLDLNLDDDRLFAQHKKVLKPFMNKFENLIESVSDFEIVRGIMAIMNLRAHSEGFMEEQKKCKFIGNRFYDIAFKKMDFLSRELARNSLVSRERK